MTYSKRVRADETARFESGEVHPYYGTFALGRDAEWSTRLFVLEMKEEGEEGIGTYLNIEHIGPARVGELVTFTARFERLDGRHLHCSFFARCGEREIAKGTTGQMILSEERLKKLYNAYPKDEFSRIDPES